MADVADESASTYQLTYCGQPFRMLDPQHADRLERFNYLHDLRDVLAQGQVFPGENLLRLGPTMPLAYPPLRIGDWFRPVGASRTSIFRGWMAAADLEAVQESLDGDTLTAGPFVMQSDGGGTDGSIDDQLFMLPPIPVGGKGSADPQIFLVTLVDERYFWHQWSSAGAITCSSFTGTDTWSGLLNALASALRITLTYTAPDAVYGQPEPDSAIYSNQESPAAILDAVAANIGCSVIRTGAAEYALQRYADSNTQVVLNQSGASGANGNNLTGGLALNSGSAANEQQAYGAMMPESVTVCFPGWTEDVGYIQPESYRWQYLYGSYGQTYSVTVDASSLGDPYSEYDTFNWAKVLHTTAKAIYDEGGSLTNGSQLASLANQLAEDYYDSRANWINESYPGIYDWENDGINDVLYCWRMDGVIGRGTFTHVLAPHFNAGLSEFQHGFGPLTPAAAAGVSLIAESSYDLVFGEEPDGDFYVSTGSGTPVGFAYATIVNAPFEDTSMNGPYVLPDYASQDGPGIVTLADQVFGAGSKTVQGCGIFNPTGSDDLPASLVVWDGDGYDVLGDGANMLFAVTPYFNVNTFPFQSTGIANSCCAQFGPAGSLQDNPALYGNYGIDVEGSVCCLGWMVVGDGGDGSATFGTESFLVSSTVVPDGAVMAESGGTGFGVGGGLGTLGIGLGTAAFQIVDGTGTNLGVGGAIGPGATAYGGLITDVGSAGYTNSLANAIVAGCNVVNGFIVSP